MPFHLLPTAGACLLFLNAVSAVHAQTVPSASLPAAAASAPEKPVTTPAATEKLERVVISGSASDTELRRQSSASKIIIGREEIERFGDSTVGEVLKRLPGVTTGGRPGRGGDIRMRGMGGGYTQILIDGERMPPGFSLDSLTPEQVERIEVMRAPTAEFGARAVAGTINVVLREALQKRLNELRLGTQLENSRVNTNLSWTRNDKMSELLGGLLGSGAGDAYSLSVSTFHNDRLDPTHQHTFGDTQDMRITGQSHDSRTGLHMTGRLQWRLGQGDSFSLQPFAVFSKGRGDNQQHLVQTPGQAQYDTASTEAQSRFGMFRLAAQYQKRLGEATRLEVKSNLGKMKSHSQSERLEFNDQAIQTRAFSDVSDVAERSWSLTGKLSHELVNEHSVVAGLEAEGVKRQESRVQIDNGQPVLNDFGDTFGASTLRLAAYIQDEWKLNKQWSAYAGLRWESIQTRSDDAQSDTSSQSRVWSPLFHTVWKPSETSKDQVRLSLTRSYRAPAVQALMARPTLSLLENSQTHPDTVGNPQLKPELATGIDLAFEHYLSSGGLLSINFFDRHIQNLMRPLVTLTNVPWSDEPRWVSQFQNIGTAVSRGVELEAKGRLSEIVDTNIALNLRANLSFFRSSVAGVPEPDNRIDGQPAATANLGADYRLKTLPLTLGGNLNWTPETTVRQSDIQTKYTGTKRVLEGFAAYTVSPDLTVRLTATNLLPLDYRSASTVGTETTETLNKTMTQIQLRFEFRL